MAMKRAGPRPRARQPDSAGGTKRALIVAINHYGNPQNDLPSCLKDAAQFRSVLQAHYGFENLTELYDSDATAANVDAGLSWLLQDASDDDRLVFFYSGHGYQQPRNGNLEECLVLGNLEFYFDDRLSQLSQSAAPGALTVVLDSCFSGGMDKRILTGEGVEIARTKLWVPPPDFPRGKSLSAGPLVPRPFGCQPVKGPDAVKRIVLGPQIEPGTKAGGPQAADEAGQLQLNGLLLSACSENETASAATSATEGMSAFTYALTRTLPASGDIAVTRLHDDVRARLAEMGFHQTPLLRAPARPPDLAARSFVTLVPIAGTGSGAAGKSLPAEAGGESSDTDQTGENSAMTDQTTYDQQFWQTVERVAAEVASAARNGPPAGGKSLVPAPRPATPSQANGQGNGQASPSGGGTAMPAAPGGATAAPARPAGGTDAGAEPEPAATMPATSAPSGDGAAGAEQKWIGAALSIAASLAPVVIDAFRKRRKDFTPDGPDAEEKLLGTVTEVVTPAVIDAITRSPKDFAPDGDDADAKGFPWGAVARVVGSAVPSIIGEVFRRKDFAPELATDAAVDDDKGPGLVAGAVTPAIIEAIARGQQSSGAGAANGAEAAEGDGKGIPWGAVARVAASVVPAVVGEITRKKIYAPGMQPSLSPGFVRVAGNAGDGGGQRYVMY